MLVLTRKAGQKIVFKSNSLELTVQVVYFDEKKGKICLRIDADSIIEAMIKGDNGAS